jgi:hypothetical protein
MTNKILINELYLSGSEGDDTDNGNYIPEEQSSDRDSEDSRTSFRRNVNKSLIARKCQKHDCKPEHWICNKQKQVMRRTRIHNKRGKKIQARVVKPPCTCEFRCMEKVPEHTRVDIFRQNWEEKKDVNLKRQFICSCVEVNKMCRSRPRNGGKQGKNNSLITGFL